MSCSSKKKEKQQDIIVKDTTTQVVKLLNKGKENLTTRVTEIKEEENKIEKTIDTLLPKKNIRTISEYKKSINYFSKKKVNNKLIKTTDVENITPTTEEEFSFYYSLTYSDDKNQQIHDAITSEILDKAIEDKGSVLFLYLNMAGFVDGEYAEGYHAYIENVTTNNKTKFCAIYKYLSKKSKWILEPLYNEVCKGIKRQEEDY
jgi:hypothetical protein